MYTYIHIRYHKAFYIHIQFTAIAAKFTLHHILNLQDMHELFSVYAHQLEQCIYEILRMYMAALEQEPLLPIISTKSLPAMTRNGTSDSAATALARRVFPHPGGPNNRAPLGILAPRLWKKSIQSGQILQAHVYVCMSKLDTLRPAVIGCLVPCPFCRLYSTGINEWSDHVSTSLEELGKHNIVIFYSCYISRWFWPRKM